MPMTLAELRRLHKPPLSQRQLARLLGVAPGTVANWETGHRTPSLSMAKRIARIFGVSVDEIEFGRGNEAQLREERRSA